MEFRVLGPVEVLEDERLAVTAAKERIVLSVLLVNRGRVVAVDELIDSLWGDSPPRTAGKTLQTYVLHLRRFVPDRIVTQAPGYVLHLRDHDLLDLQTFEQLVRDGRLALLREDAARAALLIDRALLMWRGAPFDGADCPGLEAEANRLGLIRADATETWFEARLESGGDESLVADMEAALVANPLRERLWALLMQALYRAGRQADALRAYQRARTALVDELGIEPGTELRDLESAILAQDPALDRDTPPPVPRFATTVDGYRIAYWTRGDGPVDVLLCAEWLFNLELLWEMPGLRPFLDLLSREARLIVVQRRGSGLSDRNPTWELDPPEACVPDVDAVVAELGCGRLSLAGWGHGGQVALAYAAARPDRVERLAVVNGYARLSAAPGYTAGFEPDVLEGFLSFMAAVWGTDAAIVPILGPVDGFDLALRVRAARLNRLTATTREAVATQRRVNDFDVRHLVDRVRCPALVLDLEGSVVGPHVGRWLASHLPEASHLVLPGAFIPSDDEARKVATALVEFLVEHRDPTGGRAASAE